MKKLCFTIFAALAICAASPAFAQDQGSFNKTEQADIEKIVEDFIVDNPQILVKAMENLQQSMRDEQNEAALDAVNKHRKELEQNPDLTVMGNPDGDVTIVEFFDYNCGYCKVMFKILRDIVKEDGNIRWVVVDLALIAPESVYAAKAAIASKKQDKYIPFHAAMMTHKGTLSEPAIKSIAKRIGIDVDQLEKDINSNEVKQQLKDNLVLATEKFKIRGVPNFIIGNEILRGAVTSEKITEAVSKARK